MATVNLPSDFVWLSVRDFKSAETLRGISTCPCRVKVIAFIFFLVLCFLSPLLTAEKDLNFLAFVPRTQRRKRAWWAPWTSRAAGTTRSRWICWRKGGYRAACMYNSPAVEFHSYGHKASQFKKLNSIVSACCKSESPLIHCHKKMVVIKIWHIADGLKSWVVVHHGKTFCL